MEIKVSGKDADAVERLAKRIQSQNPDIAKDCSKGKSKDIHSVTLAVKSKLELREVSK